MWMAKKTPYLPRFKIAAFWNDLKSVKNSPVLYVLNAGVVEDTGVSWLGFYNLFNWDSA